MTDEIELMEASHKFEISRIKAQLLADITFEMVKKYDYVSYCEIEEIAKKSRFIVASVFNLQCEAKGGEQC